MKQFGEPEAEVVSTQRWLLTIPVTAAVGEDVWCACLFCGRPRQGTNPFTNRMVGKPVQFLVRIRDSFGTTAQKGLHKDCWQLNVKDVPDYIGALDAANKLIGEAADEALNSRTNATCSATGARGTPRSSCCSGMWWMPHWNT